jgi:hypothetical protein
LSYYDPTTGTFLTRDPLSALTRSAYGYAYGNPLNASDPSDLYCISGVAGHDGDGNEICNGAGEIADNVGPDNGSEIATEAFFLANPDAARLRWQWNHPEEHADYLATAAEYAGYAEFGATGLTFFTGGASAPVTGPVAGIAAGLGAGASLCEMIQGY